MASPIERGRTVRLDGIGVGMTPQSTSIYRRRHEVVLEHGHDHLTGLLGHQPFRTRADNLLALGELAPREGVSYAFVYFNVENFKHYNQRYGFEAGDELILHVSQFIQEAFPGSDVARFSADQFVALVMADEVEQGVRAVRSAFRREHKDISIWLRAGYYVITADDRDAGVAFDHAKTACDELRGRRDVYLREYDTELRHEIAWRRYVLEHFEEALANGNIQAWCQPIIRVATGETCDVEALARWMDPNEGLVPPNRFVPVLEEARLIHLLDLTVLRDLCRTCREYHDRGIPYIPMSFNISKLDFELCDIVDEVTAIVDEYGLPHELISVEITESTLAGNQEFLRGEVDRFREAGFEVWIDDFGSGYSSLNVLKNYQFDLIKVDMGFIRDFDKSEKSRIILTKIIDMAKELGVKTLVEGVETQEQYDYLRSLGCGRVQGWLFGKPMPLPSSVEGAANSTHPNVELIAKRNFYENVGRVNLMRPDPRPSAGHYLPSDVAACIIRRRNGRYEYLNTNELYEQFLIDAGIGSFEDSEAGINDPSDPRNAAFVDVIDRCAESGEWERYHLVTDDVEHVVRMRMIDQIEEFDAIAVLSIVDEVVERE